MLPGGCDRRACIMAGSLTGLRPRPRQQLRPAGQKKGSTVAEGLRKQSIVMSRWPSLGRMRLGMAL